MHATSHARAARPPQQRWRRRLERTAAPLRAYGRLSAASSRTATPSHPSRRVRLEGAAAASATAAAHALARLCLDERRAAHCYDAAWRAGAAPTLVVALAPSAPDVAAAASLALGSMLLIRAESEEALLRAVLRLDATSAAAALLEAPSLGGNTVEAAASAGFLQRAIGFGALPHCPTASLFVQHNLAKGASRLQLERWGAAEARSLLALLRGADERLCAGCIGVSYDFRAWASGPREACGAETLESALLLWARPRDPWRHPLRALRAQAGGRAPRVLPRAAWELSSLGNPMFLMFALDSVCGVHCVVMQRQREQARPARGAPCRQSWPRQIPENGACVCVQGGHALPVGVVTRFLGYVVRVLALGAAHVAAPCEELDHMQLSQLCTCVAMVRSSSALAAATDAAAPTLDADAMALAQCHKESAPLARTGYTLQANAIHLAVALVGDREEGAGEGVALSRELVLRVVSDAHTTAVYTSGSGIGLTACLIALRRVCVSDSNKAHVIADARALELFAAVLRWGTPLLDAVGECELQASRDYTKWSAHNQNQSVLGAAEAVFQLALSEASRGALSTHDGCMRSVRYHAVEKTGTVWPVRVRECCRGTLAALEAVVVAPQVPAGTGMADTGHSAPSSVGGAKHLMVRTAVVYHTPAVSYQWDRQPTVIRVVEALKQRGFAMWFDLEAMSGSTLDAMAEAIEGAACALVCMTAAYKKSANCRLEGNYIHNVKLPWVPLLMEEGYVATGWLGIMLGSRLYFKVDTSTLADNVQFERRIDEIVTEVRRRAPRAQKTAAYNKAAAMAMTPTVPHSVPVASVPAASLRVAAPRVENRMEAVPRAVHGIRVPAATVHVVVSTDNSNVLNSESNNRHRNIRSSSIVVNNSF